MDSKGQTAMLELMIGVVLVLMLLVAITASFSRTFSSGENERRLAVMTLAAENALNHLTRSAGTANWENQNGIIGNSCTLTSDCQSINQGNCRSGHCDNGITDLGLAKETGLLSVDKLVRFEQWTNFDSNPDSYYRTKQLFGLAEYDFFLRVKVRNCTASSCSEVEFPVSAPDGTPLGEIGRSEIYHHLETSPDYSTVVFQQAAVLDSGWIEGVGAISNEPVILELRVFRIVEAGQ